MDRELTDLKENEIYIRLQYLEDRKVIDIIRQFKDKRTLFHKEKPVEGKSTSSKIITTKDEICFYGPTENP